jgi:hypothetical protein
MRTREIHQSKPKITKLVRTCNTLFTNPRVSKCVLYEAILFKVGVLEENYNINGIVNSVRKFMALHEEIVHCND